MGRQKKAVISDFYCTKCGQRGIPIARTGKMREPGHLKKLYCLCCNEQTNFVEIRPFGRYTYEDFMIEYQNHNFTENGQRIIPSYKQFKAFVRDEVWDVPTQTVIPKKEQKEQNGENKKTGGIHRPKNADIYEW